MWRIFRFDIFIVCMNNELIVGETNILMDGHVTCKCCLHDTEKNPNFKPAGSQGR